MVVAVAVVLLVAVSVVVVVGIEIAVAIIVTVTVVNHIGIIVLHQELKIQHIVKASFNNIKPNVWNDS